MSVVLVLIAISILVAGGFLGAFIWAVKSGQYEDTFSPAVRMLFENKKEKAGNNPAAGANAPEGDVLTCCRPMTRYGFVRRPKLTLISSGYNPCHTGPCTGKIILQNQKSEPKEINDRYAKE